MARKKKPTADELTALYHKLSSEEQEAFSLALMSDPQSLIHKELVRLTEREITLRYIVEDAEQEARQALKKQNKGKRSDPKIKQRDALAYWRHHHEGRSLGEIALDLGKSESHVAHMIDRHIKRHSLARPTPPHTPRVRH
jgi:hypothetical protein